MLFMMHHCFYHVIHLFTHLVQENFFFLVNKAVGIKVVKQFGHEFHDPMVAESVQKEKGGDERKERDKKKCIHVNSQLDSQLMHYP